MLWTDRVFITKEDLQRVDGDIDQAVEAESFTMDTSAYGFLRSAQEETANELNKKIMAFGGGYLSNGDVSVNHLAAVMNVGARSAPRQKILMQQICVSGQSAGAWNNVKVWAVHWALYQFFRNCSGRTVKDRYESKMRYYRSEIVRRLDNNLGALGLPIVSRPLSAPGAVYERDAGTWDSSCVTLVNGGGTTTTTQYVSITYVDMSNLTLYVSPTQKNNAESAPSEPVAITMISGKVILIDVGGLTPPTGRQHPSTLILCVIAPLAATHWNVYVGPDANHMRLQNASPIPVATTTYTLAGDPTTNLPIAGDGQYEDRRLLISNTRQRA